MRGYSDSSRTHYLVPTTWAEAIENGDFTGIPEAEAHCIRQFEDARTKAGEVYLNREKHTETTQWHAATKYGIGVRECCLITYEV